VCEKYQIAREKVVVTVTTTFKSGGDMSPPPLKVVVTYVTTVTYKAAPRDVRQRASVSRSLSSSLPLPASPPAPAPASIAHHRPYLSARGGGDVVEVQSQVSPKDIPTPATVEAIFDVRQLH